MHKEYYILDNNEKTGPFTYSDITAKSISPETRVAADGGQFLYASELPDFIDYFAPKGIYFPTGDNLAGFGIKAAALIIDIIILIVPLEYAFIKTGMIIVPESIEKFVMPPSETLLLIQGLFCLSFVVYNTLLEMSKWKGSIGKKICSLAVVDVDGKSPGLLRSLGRNFGAFVSFNFLYGLPFLSMLFNEHKQTWYDSLAKTYVIKTN